LVTPAIICSASFCVCFPQASSVLKTTHIRYAPIRSCFSPQDDLRRCAAKKIRPVKDGNISKRYPYQILLSDSGVSLPAHGSATVRISRLAFGRHVEIYPFYFCIISFVFKKNEPRPFLMKGAKVRIIAVGEKSKTQPGNFATDYPSKNYEKISSDFRLLPEGKSIL
jgi:hypothetical protein